MDRVHEGVHGLGPQGWSMAIAWFDEMTAASDCQGI